MPRVDSGAPVVSRQSPKSNGRVSASPGSVLSDAIEIGELQDSWIKMLIYGQNGTGKTTLACDFEKPLLLLSFEPNETGGARSVRKVPGVTFLKLRPTRDKNGVVTERVTEKAYRLADELKVKNPFRTVVFDHVTAFQDVVLQEILNVENLPEQLNFGSISSDDYRMRAERTKEGLRPWVDLPCHTVFIAKEKDHNPPKEEKINPRTGKVQPDMKARFLRGLQMESFVTADLGGGTAGWIMDACDYLCRLYFDREVVVKKNKVQGQEVVTTEETGRFVRALRTTYHPNFAARFRSDTPDNLPEAIADPTYAKILAAIEGRKVS